MRWWVVFSDSCHRRMESLEDRMIEDAIIEEEIDGIDMIDHMDNETVTDDYY